MRCTSLLGKLAITVDLGIHITNDHSHPMGSRRYGDLCLPHKPAISVEFGSGFDTDHDMAFSGWAIMRFGTADYGCYSASLNSLYSTLSTSASQLASMTFSLTPTVLQTSFSSRLSMTTRTRAAVPSAELMTRTL